MWEGLLSLNLRGRSLGGVFLSRPFPPTNFWGLSETNKSPQVLFRLRSIRAGAQGMGVASPVQVLRSRRSAPSARRDQRPPLQVWFGCLQTAKRRPMDAIPPRYNGAI
jgi:hypothetical protein